MSSVGSTFSRGGWVELLKTYNAKSSLKFLSLTAVRPNFSVWQLSSLTAVKLDSCQPTPAVYMNIYLSPPWFFSRIFFTTFLVRNSLLKNMPKKSWRTQINTHIYGRRWLTASCLTWQLSDLTAVRPDSCQTCSCHIWQLSANACRIYEYLSESAMIF